MRVNPNQIINKNSLSGQRKSVVNKALQENKFGQLNTNHQKMKFNKQFEAKNTSVNFQTKLTIERPVQRFTTEKEDKIHLEGKRIHSKEKIDIKANYNEVHTKKHDLKHHNDSKEHSEEKHNSIENTDQNSKKFASEKEVRLNLENEIESLSSMKDIHLMSEDSDKRIISTPHAMKAKPFLNNLSRKDIEEPKFDECDNKVKISKELTTKLEILNEANEKSEEKETHKCDHSLKSSKLNDVTEKSIEEKTGEKELLFSIVEADKAVSEIKNFHKCFTGNLSNKNNQNFTNEQEFGQSANNLCVHSDIQNCNSPRPIKSSESFIKDQIDKSPSNGNETVHDIEGKEKISSIEASHDNLPLTLKIPEFNNPLIINMDDVEDSKERNSPKFTKNSSAKESEIDQKLDSPDNINHQEESKIIINDPISCVFVSNDNIPSQLEPLNNVTPEITTSESHELAHQKSSSNPTIKINLADFSDKTLNKDSELLILDSQREYIEKIEYKIDNNLGVQKHEYINRKPSREVKLRDDILYYSTNQVNLNDNTHETFDKNKRKAAIDCQNSIETITKNNNDCTLSVSSDEHGFVKSICSEMPNIISLEPAKIPLNIKLSDKLSVNENSSSNHGVKSAVEHSNTVDSNFSKLGIDTYIESNKLHLKNPISKQSVLTFNYSNDQSPHNIEKMTSGVCPSFNGDYDFQVQTNEQESGSNKFPGFNLRSELTSSLEGAADIANTESNYPLINLNDALNNILNTSNLNKKPAQEINKNKVPNKESKEVNDVIEISSIKSSLPIASSYLKFMPRIIE